jgi:hypothetical protein
MLSSGDSSELGSNKGFVNVDERFTGGAGVVFTRHARMY